MGQSGQQRGKWWVNLVNNERSDGSIWSTTREGMGQSGQQRWKEWVNLVNNEGRDGSIWSTTREGMGQSGQQLLTATENYGPLSGFPYCNLTIPIERVPPYPPPGDAE